MTGTLPLWRHWSRNFGENAISTEKLDYLTEDDLRYLSWLVSPAYVLPSAERYGSGDPVLGARKVSQEVRRLIKSYYSFIRHREGVSSKDLLLAQNLRDLGYVGFKSTVSPISETTWRTSSRLAWSSSGASDIPGAVKIQVGEASKKEVDRAVIRAVSQMLVEEDDLNRALLQDRLYQRDDGRVLLNMEIASEEIVSISIDASALSDKQLKRKVYRGMKSALASRRRNSELRKIGEELSLLWCEVGFIASPAGAMISCPTGVEQGWSALFEPNGIPLAFNVCDVIDGEFWLCVRIDHRVFDGSHASRIYQFMKRRVPELLLSEGT